MHQFTTNQFAKPLLVQGVKVSMDGKDNIFVENRCGAAIERSVTHKNIYLKMVAKLMEKH